MMKAFIKFVLTFGILGFLVLGIWHVYFYFSPNSDDPAVRIVLVEPGSFKKTVDQLSKEGLIAKPDMFYRIGRVLGIGKKVRVGEYEFRLDMTPAQIYSIITSGKSVLHPVKIPEGYNLEQIAEELASQGLVEPLEFVKLAQDAHMVRLMDVPSPSLEGYLFPDTYSFTKFTGDRVIIKTMVDRFKTVYNTEVKEKAQSMGMSMHDVVTLASIIEKETGAAQERPMISSVFHNRLRQNMPLQSDPTVIYGKVGDKKNITRLDLTTPSPYNTYTRRGLPVGPISNPGRESLLAAVSPAKTNYLYFVSKNEGFHFFSSTFKDHNAAVTRFQKNPEARKNKSWRDRLKLESSRKK